MGVPGLWDLLRPAAARTSLSALAREAFLANRSGLRALTIGIDASIWIFHAQVPVGGENPFLRTIFYKIAALLQQPVLPVFVFDGPNKPDWKRNAKVMGKFGTADRRSRQFKELLDVCGLEWWNAPGEAEAELAIMNRQGKIDAVLSDDVDALLFGATCLLRNNSPTLSGAQASSTQANSSRSDQRHYEVYRSSSIHELWTEKEGTRLVTEEDCRRAMVLVALLGGGDYAPEGLPGFGPTITHALAHAGFADFLVQYTSDPDAFQAKVASVHDEMVSELRHNTSMHLGRRYPDRASKLAQEEPASLFPMTALDAFLRPSPSPLFDQSLGWPGFGNGESSHRRGKARNEGRGDLEGMAQACERFFEWGTKDLVTKKFGSESVGIFSGEVMEQARRAVMRGRSKPSSRPSSPTSSTTPKRALSPVAGPSRITSFFQQAKPSTYSSASAPKTVAHSSTAPARAIFPPIPSHILRIHSVRKSPTSADISEYRIAYRHDAFVDRCQRAMEGIRCDPRDLPAETREALGLVERAEPEDFDTVSQTVRPGKTELRVWMPDYLVQEAWPVLIAAYEEGLQARAKGKTRTKTKSPKKVVVARNVVKGKPGRRKEMSPTEEAERFRMFFTQKSGRSSSPIEEPETIEASTRSSSRSRLSSTQRSASPFTTSMPTAVRGRRKTSRVPSSSSSLTPLFFSSPRSLSPPTLCAPKAPLSSSPPGVRRGKARHTSLRLDSPTTPLKLSTPTSKRRERQISSTSGSSSLSGPARVHRSPEKRSKQVEPIDLCSSSDESMAANHPTRARGRVARIPSSTGPPAPGQTPPRRSPRHLHGTPMSVTSLASNTTLRASPSRARSSVPSSPPLVLLPKRTTPSRQSTSASATLSNRARLAGQGVQGLQMRLDMPVVARSPVKEAGKPAARRKGRVSYVVEFEDEECEIIDSTRGR